MLKSLSGLGILSIFVSACGEFLIALSLCLVIVVPRSIPTFAAAPPTSVTAPIVPSRCNGGKLAVALNTPVPIAPAAAPAPA